MECRGKYNARPVEIDGIRFASEAEARRYGELRLLERAGEICLLEVHPTFPLVVNGQRVAAYEADFSYRDASGLIVEDVKGVRTRDFIIRRKLMKAVYGIDVREIRA